MTSDTRITETKQWKTLYEQHLPELTSLARTSPNAEDFKQRLAESLRLSSCMETVKHLQTLIAYDQTGVHELSTGERMQIQTLTYLWQWLNGLFIADSSVDLFIDLFHQFNAYYHPRSRLKPDRNRVKRQMSRWATGLDEEVMQIRTRNKRRIIGLLVKKIERHRTPSSRYYFPEGMTDEEKTRQVNEWWSIARFHLTMAIKSPSELNAFLGDSLSADTLLLLTQAKRKGMPFFVTPYYLSLLNTGDEGYDDATIRSYIFYSRELIDTYGSIKA
ncbi:MAG: KamA family protein, partial [Prevotellaceae bacterium]|nr:KamA family protein [Prevotellaceae bacterium]